LNIISNLFNGRQAKGFVISFDASFTAFILFCMVFLLCSKAFSSISFSSGANANLFLQEKALFISDSFVKNSNPENYFLGSAFYDSAKKRIISNKIDSFAVSKLSSQSYLLSGIKVSSLSFQNPYTHSQISKPVFSYETKNCVVVKRFVLFNEQKTLVELKICN
jgi:hypothetical protein